jgi:hypothetical protein
LLNQFNKLNFKNILPFLNLYLAEMFLEDKNIEKAKELLKSSDDTEVHRLWAWIYRMEGKNDLAEKELVKYKKSWQPEIGKGFTCKPVPLNAPESVPESLEKIFDAERLRGNLK